MLCASPCTIYIGSLFCSKLISSDAFLDLSLSTSSGEIVLHGAQADAQGFSKPASGVNFSRQVSSRYWLLKVMASVLLNLGWVTEILKPH